MEEKLHLIAPYNFWGGNALPVGYRRKLYTDRLMKYVGNRLIKVLIGQRRVGKSYIMRQIASELIRQGVKPENTLFINCELSVFNFIRTADDLNRLIEAYRQTIAGKGRLYIFIDEVQEIDEWERVVNSYSQDYTVEVELFISGSNSRLLSGELASLLSGRYIELPVYPLSFREYTEVYELPGERQSFMRYLSDGGLPEMVNLPDREVKERYVSGLRDSIMLKDIVKRYTIKDVDLLENLFGYLVNNASSLVSVNAIVNYLKSHGSRSTYDTVAAYILYLQEAYLMHRSGRYNVAGKEILSGSFKAYANDQAYHNYLFPTARYGNGYLLENIVYMELLRQGFKVATGVISGREIDFVATDERLTLYVQVSYMLTDDATAEREYAPLESVKGIGEKLLVTLDDTLYPTRNGIRHVRAWELSEALEKLQVL